MVFDIFEIEKWGDGNEGGVAPDCNNGKKPFKKLLLGNNGSIEISYISPSTIWYLRNAGGSNPSLPTKLNSIRRSFVYYPHRVLAKVYVEVV